MCLYIDRKETIKVLRRLHRSKSGKIKVYKLLKVNDKGKLVSPIFTGKPWKAGIRKSSRESTMLGMETTRIDEGIHVFLNLSSARKVFLVIPWSVIIPVWCRKEDFVAAGYGEAVFTRVEVLEKDLKSILDFSHKKKG